MKYRPNIVCVRLRGFDGREKIYWLIGTLPVVRNYGSAPTTTINVIRSIVLHLVEPLPFPSQIYTDRYDAILGTPETAETLFSINSRSCLSC